ncbi:hypothetical protein ACWEO4_13255 [Streptomyces sp. NPDC004393]
MKALLVIMLLSGPVLLLRAGHEVRVQRRLGRDGVRVTGTVVRHDRFEDEAQSEALYKAVYHHDRWKNEIGPAVYAPLIPEETVVTRVVPTPASPLR